MHKGKVMLRKLLWNVICPVETILDPKLLMSLHNIERFLCIIQLYW